MRVFARNMWKYHRKGVTVLLAFLAIMLVFASGVGQAYAAKAGIGQPNAPSVDYSCQAMRKGNPDDTAYCLPIGRWSQYVGGVTGRTDPADGFQGILDTIGNQVNYIRFQMLPTMLLNLMQLCWNIALGVNQFALTFNPLTSLGQQVDKQAGIMVGQLLSGQNTMLLMVVVSMIMMAVGWVVFRAGSGGVVKKSLTTLLCIMMLVVMGAQGAKSTATTPATLSPWWMVRTIDRTANQMLTGLDLQSSIGHNKHMMSHAHDGKRGCANYLNAMEKEYSDAVKSTSGGQSVMKAINLMWEETALRAWVTAQYGNPNRSGGTTQQMAEDAQYAYCHVLELQAGTDARIQMNLTNKQLGIPEDKKINEKTAGYIFGYDGWIDPLNGAVFDDDKSMNVPNSTLENRAALFWNTCGYTDKGPYARSGWWKVMADLDGPNMADIRNGSVQVRVAAESASNGSGKQTLANVKGPLYDKMAHEATSDDDRGKRIPQLCKAVLGNGAFQADDTGNKKNTDNLYDAAVLGWAFDFPNVNKTYEDTHLSGITDGDKDDNKNVYAVKKTLKLMDSGNGRNLAPMWGSLLGSLVNMFVWGLLGIFIIFSKLMLILMALFLVVILLLEAIPSGGLFEGSVKRWLKKTLDLSLVSGLYTMIGSLDVFICNAIDSVLSDKAGSTIYVTVIGLAPLVGLLVIGFVMKLAGKSGMFTLRGVADAVGAGALVGGMSSVGRHIRGGAQAMARRRFYGFGRKNKGGEGVTAGGHASRSNANVRQSDGLLEGIANGDAKSGRKGVIGQAKDLSQRMLEKDRLSENALRDRLRASGDKDALLERDRRSQGLRDKAERLSNKAAVASDPVRRAGLGVAAGVAGALARRSEDGVRLSALKAAHRVRRAATVGATVVRGFSKTHAGKEVGKALAGVAVAGAAVAMAPATLPASVAVLAGLGSAGRHGVKGMVDGVYALRHRNDPVAEPPTAGQAASSAPPTVPAPVPEPRVVPSTLQAAQRAKDMAAKAYAEATSDYKDVKESQSVLRMDPRMAPAVLGLDENGLAMAQSEFEQDRRVAGEKVGSAKRLQENAEKDWHDVNARLSESGKGAE